MRGRLRALLLSALLLGACHAPPPYVYRPPPQPPDPSREERPLKPGPDVFWRSGRYAWDEEAQIFYWESGLWEAERPGQLWIPGYWEQTTGEAGERAWLWVPDHWEPLEPR